MDIVGQWERFGFWVEDKTSGFAYILVGDRGYTMRCEECARDEGGLSITLSSRAAAAVTLHSHIKRSHRARFLLAWVLPRRLRSDYVRRSDLIREFS